MNPINRGSLPSMDDIPEARREVLITSTPNKSTFKPGWWVVLILGVMAVGGLGWWWVSRAFATATEQETIATQSAETLRGEADPSIVSANTSSDPSEANAIDPQAAESGSGENATPPLPSPNDAAALEAQATLLGHHQYEVADPTTLVALSDNSLVKLKPVAAQKVEAMLAKARVEGVQLGTVSGYRSLEDQHFLFFEVKADRGQNSITRAEVSAPPGYSEHHTGYAIDFVDRSRPETDLEVTFEQTPAFRWLQKNAAHFGLEMSFTKDNAAVSYEPWHWRYVGDRESLETFYQE